MEENTNQNVKPTSNSGNSGTPVKPGGTQIKPSGTRVKPGGTQIKPNGTQTKPTNTQQRPQSTTQSQTTAQRQTQPQQQRQTTQSTASQPQQRRTQQTSTVQTSTVQKKTQAVDLDKEIEKTEQPRPEVTETTVRTHSESTVEYIDTTPEIAETDSKKKSKAKKEKVPKEPKPAKAKKEKAPKEPKQPKEKANKQPKQPKATKSPDDKKKSLMNILKVVIILAVVIVILVIVSKILSSGSDQHLTYADPVPSLEEQQANLKVKQVTYDGVTTTVATEDTMVSQTVSTEPVWEFTDNSNPITAGTKITFPVSVNTKLEGDTQYSDYYSFIVFELTDIAIGYDNVINSVLAYNNTGTNVLNIGTKEDFYANNADNEIVMFDVDMTIPSDFPTQDTKKGRVFIEPSADLVLKGSDDEESIITNKYVYAVPTLSNISDDVSELYAGETYHFRWIAIVPNDITGDMYNMTLTLTQKDDTMVYEVQGMDIASSSSNTSSVANVTTDTTEKETEAVESETTEVETEDTTDKK